MGFTFGVPSPNGGNTPRGYKGLRGTAPRPPGGGGGHRVGGGVIEGTFQFQAVIPLSDRLAVSLKCGRYCNIG